MKKLLAADLFEGSIVRLKKGDYAQMTVYQKDPFNYIKSLMDQGIQDFHLVDLQGAKDPQKRQTDLLKKILSLKKATFQIGGGIRTLDQCLELVDMGINKLVVGTKVIEDRKFLETLLEKVGGDKIIVSLDVLKKDDSYIVMKNAWQESSSLTLNQCLDDLIPLGVKEILCTDISKDGLLAGPSYGLYEYIGNLYPGLRLIASGGVRDKQNLEQLKNMGMHAAVIGTAFYEKHLEIRDLL